MPATEIRETIPATSEAVFDLIHDYDRRLRWDTLLSEAYIEPGCEGAARGAVAVCRGKGLLGMIMMRTEYVSFERGKVAAVKMLGHPPFFESFAASIRHRDLGDGSSEVIYKLNFRSRPRVMCGLLHPPMLMLLKWETRKRLAALRRFFENGGTAN